SDPCRAAAVATLKDTRGMPFPVEARTRFGCGQCHFHLGKRCQGVLNVRIACPVLFDAAQFAIHSFRIHLTDGIMGRGREAKCTLASIRGEESEPWPRRSRRRRRCTLPARALFGLPQYKP